MASLIVKPFVGGFFFFFQVFYIPSLLPFLVQTCSTSFGGGPSEQYLSTLLPCDGSPYISLDTHYFLSMFALHEICLQFHALAYV